MQQPAAFFDELARCLKPGGVAIVCTPNLLGYKNVITYLMPRALLDLAWRVLRGRPGQPHRTYYRANTPRRLRQISAATGLRIERLHYLNEVSHFFYPHPTLALLAYLYGRALEALGLERLLNYLVCVLHKPAPAASSAERLTLERRYRRRLVADEALG
jgi:SAM-dependent methyltransferase